jgi:hypothetical protein
VSLDSLYQRQIVGELVEPDPRWGLISHFVRRGSPSGGASGSVAAAGDQLGLAFKLLGHVSSQLSFL